MLKSLDFRGKWLYVIGMNDNKIINLDVLKIVLDATTPSNLAKIHAKDTAPRTATPLTKDQAGTARRSQARWDAHTYWQCLYATSTKPYLLALFPSTV